MQSCLSGRSFASASLRAIREYARSLLLKGVPGPSVYTQVNTWAQVAFPPIQTAFTPDPFYRYTYMPHDTTSLYRTLKLEMGISQRSSPEGNIHIWFWPNNPSSPSPDLTAACLFYQPTFKAKLIALFWSCRLWNSVKLLGNTVTTWQISLSVSAPHGLISGS